MPIFDPNIFDPNIFDASSDVSVNAGLASGTGSAHNASIRVQPNAGAAAGTGQAYDATASTAVAAAAGAASGTGVAYGPSAHVAPNAGSSAGAGTALDSTVSTSADVSVSAEVATGTGSAYNASANVSVNAGAAAGTGSALGATASTVVSALAGVATGAGAAYNATVDIVQLAVHAATFGIDAQILGIGMHDRTDFHYGVQPDTAITYGTEVLDVVLARLFESVDSVTDPNTFRLYAYISDYVPSGDVFSLDAYIFAGHPITLNAVIHKVQKISFGISSVIGSDNPWNVVRTPLGNGVATYSAITGLTTASIHDGIRDSGAFKTWASGDWYQINWSVPQTINQVILYDTTTDAVSSSGYFGSSGELQFSDGSVVAWSGLPDQGYQGFSGVQEIPPFHPLVIDFAPRTVSSLRVVSLVGGHSRAGLAEIEAYNTDQYT